MKKSHFTEEQIAFALRKAEHGTKVVEVCRKMGVSELDRDRQFHPGELGH